MTNPPGFMPDYVTETMIGTDLEVCFHSPAIAVGESFSATWEAEMNEDAPCGPVEVGADVKSVVESISCVPGPPDQCDVFVQSSINPTIFIDLNPPIATDAIRVYSDCSAGTDPIQVCYELDLSNPGPMYTGNMHVGIHDDVTGNGTLESFDSELTGMDHALSLAPGETITIVQCLDVAAIQSCPIIINQTFETACSCDGEQTPIMSLEPGFIATLDECVVLCPGIPLEMATCGEFELTFDPAGGACLLYTSPSPRDQRGSRMPSSA